ncbi:DUF4178 domain-containing protein [Corynebacterium hansenii]|uniref:DUF4178 domain-containing protein n=1 Tax=Corynebacterium hansenii TaxID=394964 RepID=A0ABV7ZQJ8_9CORY|nr:DUF4178 domain-containing protein [Corynebacterium hansenii]WJZ01044.1 hypothetical protein CHAN_12295 [Corynebacterium hansenii]
MNLIIVVGVVIVILGVVLVVMAQKKETDDGPRYNDPLLTGEFRKFGPTSIAPGAIIGREGHDHVVRGTLALSEGPFRWWEHLLDGGRDGAWFGVEEDEAEVELTWWQRYPGAHQPTNPLVIEGIEYREQDRGTAHYRSVGTTGLPPEGTMEYIDYEADGGRLLGLERWSPNGPWEASFGHRVSPGELTVYSAPTDPNGQFPASGNDGQ